MYAVYFVWYIVIYIVSVDPDIDCKQVVVEKKNKLFTW